MLRYLKAKMLEKNISCDDIAKVIGKGKRAVRDKIAEVSAFSFPDVVKIRDTFFPSEELTSLMSSDSDASAQQAS